MFYTDDIYTNGVAVYEETVMRHDDKGCKLFYLLFFFWKEIVFGVNQLF
jgi:hypothetical protein